MGMDTSGNIRPLAEGEALREGEVKLTQEEADELLTHPQRRRHEELDRLRSEAERAELDAGRRRMAEEAVRHEARQERRHDKANAWGGAHKARMARRAERAGR